MFSRIDPYSFREQVEAADAKKESFLIIDVRSYAEFDYYHIPGAIHIPMNEIPVRYREIPQNQPVYVICEHSVRSVNVCHFLVNQGFRNLINVDGGMSAYPGKSTLHSD